ncbi:zinc/cadmium resistance protein-like [Anopheles albimanus]|uniref:Cation efflux protein cytoplasmic domain-containing protein n=1 Tax=Anopheles albimanus TaxID=7167 RepID=A0A182FVV4_ANOAL|nr:zinc/cadmium resistance protein-like [Anopheles albimanus]XP_035794425.1 zinc/cadmium resistance protein-like [Anopheles albimanus]
MPMKEWISQLQPVQLYIVLALSVAYFIVQLFVSHISHSLVLLVNSYHMMCNIIALTGCILTIKKSAKRKTEEPDLKPAEPSGDTFTEVPLALDGGPVEADSGKPALPARSQEELTALDIRQNVKVKARQARESTLKNTFGWARIDILTMLVVCIFMASFCFSAVVEALQTLFHISHHGDAMHFAEHVLVLASLGLVLNGICYLLIGGYTYHQGSFLYITSSGNVVLDHVISGDGVRKGDRRLSGSRRNGSPSQLRSKSKRESVRELMRDICSTVFVIICSVIVYYTTEETAKFVDPVLSILSCVVLIVLSYPYMKESGMILLQTIPNTIDIEIFKQSLLEGFKDIDSVHDLHIWQLSGHQYVSTVHIIFDSPKVYHTIHEAVIEFFHEQGINQVTIQPEFKSTSENRALGDGTERCLIQCSTRAQCASRRCCGTDDPQEPLLTGVIAQDSAGTRGASEALELTLVEPPGEEGPSGVADADEIEPPTNVAAKDSITVQIGPVKTDDEPQGVALQDGADEGTKQ